MPFHTGASITIGKQFYCMLQYTRFIRSGWTILATNRPDTTLAAASPSDSKHQAIVLVVSNFEGAGERSQPLQCCIPTFSQYPRGVNLHRGTVLTSQGIPWSEPVSHVLHVSNPSCQIDKPSLLFLL